MGWRLLILVKLCMKKIKKGGWNDKIYDTATTLFQITQNSTTFSQPAIQEKYLNLPLAYTGHFLNLELFSDTCIVQAICLFRHLPCLYSTVTVNATSFQNGAVIFS